MIRRMIFLGAASLMCAIPAAAQERGTVEFGAFGSGGMFNKSLTLNSGFGVGGHVGAYLDPNWAVEFEGGHRSASLAASLVSPQGLVIALAADHVQRPECRHDVAQQAESDSGARRGRALEPGEMAASGKSDSRLNRARLRAAFACRPGEPAAEN